MFSVQSFFHGTDGVAMIGPCFKSHFQGINIFLMLFDCYLKVLFFSDLQFVFDSTDNIHNKFVLEVIF